MAQLEFKAKSVKKAVALACEKLNINVADLDYQIKSYGSSGIFGLVGARKAKISVKVPSTPDKPAQKPQSRRPETLEQPQSADQETKPDTDTMKSEPAPSKPKKPDDATDPVPDGTEKADQSETEPLSLDEVSEHGRLFLMQLVDAITPDTAVVCSQDKNKISYDITDGNPAILIGKHGQTLEALQYLTEKAVNRKISQRMLVEVDVAGYQAKRQENLIDQARRMADKAARNKRPVTIGPMSPQDRRVVHLTLKSDARVRTQSIGRGITRKLTIYPKKHNSQGKRKKK